MAVSYTHLESNDELVGKTLQLHNLCNDKVATMTIDADVDLKISLSDLEPGFYEITVIDDLVEKQLVYKETLESEPFTTIRRNKQVKHATLIANKDLLQDKGCLLYTSIRKYSTKVGYSY